MLKAIHFDRENLGQLFTKQFLIVILISIPSAIVADFFNIPLAWMIGPMIATSLIALKGFKVLMPKVATFGIKTLKPFKAINDVAIIGPIIQARGMLKKSATIALGIEIKITIKNCFVNN